MLHTPEPKRNQQRPPKKGHKTKQDEDIKGVGVRRGEVTPESRSTNDDPSLMRANAATRHERSRRSGPNAEPERESSQHPGSQLQVLTLMVNVYLPEGRSHEMRYARNGVRAPVKRIGIIAKFQTCGWL